MSKVIAISDADELRLPEKNKNRKRNSQGLTTSDYPRFLSKVSLRPPTHRAFLRKLLIRAITPGATKGLPVANPVVVSPVDPT